MKKKMNEQKRDWREERYKMKKKVNQLRKNKRKKL